MPLARQLEVGRSPQEHQEPVRAALDLSRGGLGRHFGTSLSMRRRGSDLSLTFTAREHKHMLQVGLHHHVYYRLCLPCVLCLVHCLLCLDRYRDGHKSSDHFGSRL